MIVDNDIPDNITASNYLPLSGGTLTGDLNTIASSAIAAGFSIPPGVAPTAPMNGDLWSTTTGVFARINGGTVGPFGTGTENALTFTSPLSRATNTISIPAATGSTDGYLTSTDWTTFNSKQTSALTNGNIFVGNVSNIAMSVALSGDATISNTGALTLANKQTVTLSAPLSSTQSITVLGTAAPTLSIANAAADGSTKGAATFTAADFDATTGVVSLDYTNGQKATGSIPGFLSSANWTTFNNKLNLTGGTMTGKLVTVLSTTTAAGINLPHGAAPTTPVNGDLWTTTAGVFASINGTTVGPLSAGIGSVTSITATAPLTGGTITS